MTEPLSGQVFYLDASALVKRYVAEAGSSWIAALCDPSTDNQIATAGSPRPKRPPPLPASSGVTA